ncbi:MAG: hypothetical protein EP330_17715 [Deltaproteobacteria bacterium]|nr:MAG: hypothetical protein EP330_17715 [Deltaproteobacteria bacterium]
MSLLLLSLLPANAAVVNIGPGDDIVTLTSSLGADDEVIIAAGTYEIDTTMVWSGEGTQNEPITIRGEGEVIIRQTGSGTVARISDAAFLTVSGLTFENSQESYDANRSTGLEIRNSTDIAVRNNHFRHLGGTGVYVGGSDGNATERVVVERNHIEDLRDGTGIYVGCNDVTCTVLDSEIANNWVHDVSGTLLYLAHGVQNTQVVDNVAYQGGSWGIQTQSTTFGDSNIIERNVVWSVSSGIRVAGPSEVRNNLVFLCEGYGILSQNNGRDEFSDAHISHNTVYGTGDWGIRLEAWQDRSGMVLANNAVANTTGLAFDADIAEIEDHGYISGNVFSGLVDELEPGTGTFVPGGGEADFMDASNWDFYPTSSSVLLDSGDPSGEAYIPSDDFNTAPRDGANPTVGAYEWVTEGNPGWAIREAFKERELGDIGGEEIGGCCNKDPEAAEAGMLLMPFLLLWGLRRREE